MMNIESFTEVLRRILTQPGALPQDWEAEATTYDLPRFDSEAGFLARFSQAAATILAQDIREPQTLRALLTECGHPYDYARLGHPLSTLYERYLELLTGAAKAVSFASATKPYLAVVEQRQADLPVQLYADGSLPLSPAKRQALQARQVEIFEHAEARPPRDAASLAVRIADAMPQRLSAADADCFAVPEGGVLLIHDTAKIDPKRIQLIRKRTVAALLAANARLELEKLLGLPAAAPADAVRQADCDGLLQELFPQIRSTAYFCTGLAAEAAVFSAAAATVGQGEPVRLFYAQNGYGGTGQLIDELLQREGRIVPAPLPVLERNARGEVVTLVQRVIAALGELNGAPACVFLETPTNPELQVHDFAGLMQALEAYYSQWGIQVPVLVDTTLAPLYPLFALDFSQDWPFVLVKSGSKYFTKGRATLGIAACAEQPLARTILELARDYGRDADSFAKSSQLRALAAGLSDLRPRMQRIAANTRHLAQRIRADLRRYGQEVTIYAMNEEQLDAGLATGILSFYLPPAPTDRADLVDEFVDYLLAQAPDLVKSRVSYGQSSMGGQDYFYVINPQESTQGSLPEAVKDAQKQDNVQICRVSVPEHADVEGLVRAMDGFFALKYA